MRILFLADGRSIHIQRWIRFFNQQGDQTFLITLEKPAEQVTETFCITSLSSLNFLKYISAVPQIKKIVQKIKPDLINAHFVPNYGWIGARLNFRPLVVSAWGSDILISAKKSPLHRWRAGWVLKKADGLTSDANFLTEEMIKFGGDGSRISTFPMGVAEEFMKMAPKKISNKDELTIISTRRLEPVYNIELLIKAASIIIEKTNKKLKFVIVGEGSQKDKLREYVRSQNLTQFIEFRGMVTEEELMRILWSADIYVSTSLSDSTSVSLLEAFACGVVLIVTDIPGNREWIKEGVNGYLVPTNNPEALADKIVYVVSNFGNLQTMLDKNQQLVRGKANYAGNLQSLREKFLELVSLKGFVQ